MQAIIVIPPLQDFYFTPHRYSCLGAQSLLKIINDHEIKGKIINLPALKKQGTQLPLPRALSYLNPYILSGEQGRLSFFTSYKHFGPSFSESADIILNQGTSLIFISCFAFCYADQTLDLCAEIKKRNPDIPICAGGPGVSVYPEYFLKDTTIDYILIGDAEESVSAFLKAICYRRLPLSHVPNLIRKEKNRIVYSPPLLKKEEKEIIFSWNITSETKTRLSFSTSLMRGCTKKCRFCTHWAENKLYTVPEQAVLAEIDKMKSTLLHKEKELSLIFEDDNLLLKPEYFLSILNTFKTELGITSFYVETGIDYTLLHPDLLKTLIGFGLKRLNMSLGSTNKHIVNAEQRPLHLNRYEDLLLILSKEKIPSTTYFICGFKDDTVEIIAENLAYIANKPTTCGISLFYPVPGLPDFRNPEQFNTIPSNVCAGSSAYPWNSSLSTETMVTAFRLSRYSNFVKQGPLSDMEDELLHTIKTKRQLYTIIKEKKKKRIIEVPNTDKKLIELYFTLMEHKRYV